MTIFSEAQVHDTPAHRREVDEANREMALMLQGALLAASGHFLGDRLPSEELAIIQQPVRESGEVQPFFRIMLANGTCLKVQVGVEYRRPH